MTRSTDYGKLLLRLSLGIMILLHGVAKLGDIGGTVERMGGMLAANGLPSFIAWGVFFGEVVGPILVIIGFYSRIGALIVAFNMLVAIALVHKASLFSLSGSGGWDIELQGMFLLTALAIALIGPGRFALNQR